MGTYEDTELWKKTLGPQACDDPVSHAARERLRLAYVKLRERTQHLAGEIHRYLPDFTIHDVTHSDALWYTADLVLGTETLTPTEAFVLGCAFLIHDLGMGLAAYVKGINTLREMSGWKGLVAKLARDEGLVAKFNEKEFSVGFREKEVPDPSLAQEILENAKRRIEEKAIEQLLRKSHAKQAAQLLTRSWEDRYSETKISYYLIEDSELRQTYGYLIGQIAYSHWWSISEIESIFHRPKAIGAVPPPWQYPRDWKVEPLILSCLLRVADICHIDASRAPLFLRSIRNPVEPSGTHWVFQGHIQQPYLSNDRLTYTSGQPFPPEHQQAWWLCFDTLKHIDKHLRETDSLLVHLERRRLAARGVTGIEDPQFLANYIRVSDWLPLDTKLDVTNIPHLVKNLGGEALYGDEPRIPLRELIQNASDAVRARRLVDGKKEDWDEIRVRLGTGKNEESGEEQYWIEVDDTGIGMSIPVLTGPFIDFGTSYWGSPLMLDEFPDALADFHPTGKYGIGFFSVFMWGDHVTVTTRRYDDGKKDTHILEFKKGLAPRPILRMARDENEQRNDGGTCIRVWLKQSPYEKGGLLDPEALSRLRSSGERKTLYDLCTYLCPCLYINLQVREQGQDRRIEQLPRSNTDVNKATKFARDIINRLTMDEDVASEFSELKIPGGTEINSKFVNMMRTVKHPTQEDAGFACIVPTQDVYTHAFLSSVMSKYIYINIKNDESSVGNVHVLTNEEVKNLPAFTLANAGIREFTLAFGLFNSTESYPLDLSMQRMQHMHVVDIEAFRERIQIAESFFNLTVLWTKVISFFVLKLSEESLFDKEVEESLYVEKNLIGEIENCLMKEIEEALAQEFKKPDITIIFTSGKRILRKAIMEKSDRKLAEEIHEQLNDYGNNRKERGEKLDIIDLMVMRIIKVLKKAHTIVILNHFKLAEEIANFLLRLDDISSDDAGMIAKKISLLAKNNVGISLKNSEFNNNTRKRELLNVAALRIIDRYISGDSNKNDESNFIVNIVLNALDMNKWFSLREVDVKETMEIIKDVKGIKDVKNEFFAELIVKSMSKGRITNYRGVHRSFLHENFEYLYNIIIAANSQEDEKDPLLKNYYEFLQADYDLGVITTAGLRTTRPQTGFFGSLEGEVNKAIRDKAFVNEGLVSNWSTQQTREILGKSDDEAFLCSMAQMVRGYGGEVGELPIAYAIDGWKTKAKIKSLYKVADAVKLISLWPAPELLQSTSWTLQEHILVVSMSTPERIFRSKKTYLYYSLCYVVLEALAESWKVSIEDLIEQTPSLSEGKKGEVEIGTIIYPDHTEESEMPKKLYAPGHIIHRPAKHS